MGLQCAPGPIYIGLSNIQHIMTKHPAECALYLQSIPAIISEPDFVGVHPRQGGVEFVKMFDQSVMVSIRLSAKGTLYVRSLYAVNDERIQEYLRKGTLLAFPGGET